MNDSQRSRSRLVFVGVIAAALVLAAALYWTQIVKGSSYMAAADKQYDKPATSLFDRGSIFFSEKDGTQVDAATVATGYLISMNPSLLTDPAQAYEAISHYLTLDQATFMAKAAEPHDVYEELAHKVDAKTASSIAGLSILGISVVPESWRSYPGGTLAAHALGVIGEDSGSSTVTGRYGLERSFESVLTRPSIGPTANIFAQLFTGLRDSVLGDPGEGDIVTTIEPTAQAYLESELAKTQAIWNPSEVGGIVMDPKTGEIVAMASLPTFDPNDLAAVSDVGVLTDPLVQHVYEMGSIMKPLTMAMALDTGAEMPDSTYDDTGCMTLDGRRICNYDGVARHVIPMQQILSQSLNVGAATIALKTEQDIGKGTMQKYFLSYGLGSTTGIDLPNEATGIVSNLKEGSDIDIATAAFGQGIAVSPVEMVRALSILANGGYLITPHVVKEIDYTDGTKKTIDPGLGARVLPASTTDIVTNMLVNVVDQVMVPAKPETLVPHYSIASKTGTAEIADPVNGGYYPDRYLHSFFTYFPASDPQYIVFMYQIYPKGAEYASATLTDPVFDMTKFLINYYNIPPDR